ncbi:acetolactate synthase, large subunit [Tistlia consotensis]|uniref:Acetolactate synthase n=1 Tax=Tistlia consotensis USBA 355 TaxID=560819 RepID=A0A1Y6B6V5_9PROT|nr:acetolactate synthase 3 large subunit [Tistlia consotensis]SME91329.1 acetolactate synthase, large subunit [Tistlia consotensis USBA 355]SNR27317.1 acetolactate synthase, large subunit [Tistlia consotensis]
MSATTQEPKTETTPDLPNGAELLIKALVEQGVEVVFGYPGGAVLPIYDALFQQNALRHILVRHEQAAVHAAEGYARSTGKVGVVLVTSGPGATNAVTGLTDALMDSIPVVCLTGQVPTHLIGNDAFQEADTTGITRPCTKHNYLVKSVADLPRTVHEAFYVAANGRPGPVVIDLPKDVLQAKGAYLSKESVSHRSYRPQTEPDPLAVEKAVDILARAKRPIVYAGGGVINSGPSACEALRQFVRMTGAPITNTLMGLGGYPGTDPQFLGMLGMHGTYEANLAMYSADVMLCVGARFDDRVTGRLSDFSPGSTKIHIDIDPSSINKNVMVDLPVIGDVGTTLEAINRLWRKRSLSLDKKALEGWWQQIEQWRSRDCLAFTQAGDVIKPQHAIRRLYEMTRGRDLYITTEVGQHQMWAAQYFKFDEPNRWMTSGGLGTMGYGLPAALGVQVAHPESLVIDVAGEASILMNIQELSTLAQYKLPVKTFVVNNQWMGMVRQWQELLHGKRYSESYSDSLPDFVKLADAFGAHGIRVTKASQLEAAIQEMLDTPGPVIVDCCVAQDENCFPMIPSGAAHYEMLLGPNDQAAKPISEEGMVLV